MLRQRLLGIAALVLVGVVALLAITKPDPFAGRRTIWAEFDSVQGLGRIDRDVRVAGVNEGEIGEVVRVGDDALVELEVNEGIVLHDDARVELRPHTLFEGSGYVDLHPGSPSAPVLEEEAVIPRERTEVYVSLDEATRVLRAPIRRSLQDLADVGARTLRGEAIGGLQRTLRAAPGLTRGLGPTMRALRGPEGRELEGAIAGLSATVDALASQSDDLQALPPRANRTLAALLVAGGEPLDAGLAELPEVTEELAAGSDELTALIDRIDRFAVAARPVAVELAPTLRELRPLLVRTTPIARRSLPLVAGLRTILARTADAAPALARLVRVLRPGARLLDESVLPYLASDSRLGVPVYMQLLSAFSSGTAALRPYQTEAQGPLGSGHVLRLSAYLDSEFFSGSVKPSCATIAALDPTLATQFEALGLCEP